MTAKAARGHDSPAVRLVAVAVLVRLADEWIDQRQTCIEVLPATPNARLSADARIAASSATTGLLYRPSRS
jgi:hypothetical protein